MASSRRPYSLSSDSHGGTLKCAGCSNLLQNPVQLQSCQHILCDSCMTALQKTHKHHKVLCPKCKDENIIVDALQRISGFADTLVKSKVCDYCRKESAAYVCFNCGQNICSTCRGHHPRDHSLLFLPKNADITRTVFEVASLEGEEDRTDATASLRCPMCQQGGGDCDHVKMLIGLVSPVAKEESLCQVPGHILEYEGEHSGEKKKLKYFCTDCWIPVCGNCSKEGEHKHHNTPDLNKMAEYLEGESKLLCDKVQMLYLKSKADEEVERTNEERLKDHVTEVSSAMRERKLKIMEDAEYAFDRAVKAAEIQGQDIVAEHRGKCEASRRFAAFLKAIKDRVENFHVTDGEMVNGDLNVVKYVSAFKNQKDARKLLESVGKGLDQLYKPHERRLVLMECAKIAPPPLPLARVGTESAQLQLAFSFPMHSSANYATSIVATGSDSCLISCVMSDERDPDAIIYHGKDKKPEVFDTDQGSYFISQMKNREIVASKTERNLSRSAVLYSDGSFLYQSRDSLHSYASRRVKFTTVREFDYPAMGIATTQDNNILVCVDAKAEKGGKSRLSYLMLMNLQGKELKSTMAMPGPNMISPDYVAVNEQGEICISDTEGSSVVILDQDLNIQERLNFPLPTMFIQLNDTFQPHGICYDSYGRIIVADPNNHTVVRLSRDPQDNDKYRMEPLITQSSCGLVNFSYPKLVTLGPDSRLWVVCRGEVFVFDYVV